MKQQFSLVAVLIAVGFLITSNAYAATPTLSLSAVSGGDDVQVNVTGDPNSTVTFYYNVGGPSGMFTATIGTTDANGSFSKTISTSGYAINASYSVYVAVGIQQSPTQTWPYGSTSGGTLTFSQNNITLTPGQSTSVTVYGGNGSYSITNNSNTAAVSITLSGSTITVNGVVAGSASITVCDQASHCSTLSVTVGSGTSSGSLSFSQMSPSVAIGQSVTVNVSGGSAYYVSSNSNPSIALPSMNDNVVTISGIGNGTATITICSLTNDCGTITANVGSSSGTSGTSGTNPAVTFSTTNPTIAVGQNVTVTISGSSGYFVSSNSNSNVVQANMSGNVLTLSGTNPGTSSVSVCASSGGCNTLTVTVTSATTVLTTPTVTTPTVTTSVTSNTTLLAEIRTMQSQLTQLLSAIQTMQARLTQLIAGLSTTTSVPSTIGTTPTSGHRFLNLLSLTSTGTDVTELQKLLAAKGFYSGPVTGSYGPLTEAAVKMYQTAHGISPLGYVGPSTRAALNAGQ